MSPTLLAEVRRALAEPRLERLVPRADADAFVDRLGHSAELAEDATASPPIRPEDPGDDYLIALAASESAVLVSGDVHLTSLAQQIPVRRPAGFLAELSTQPDGTPHSS